MAQRPIYHGREGCKLPVQDGGTGAKREDYVLNVFLGQKTGAKFSYLPYKAGGERRRNWSATTPNPTSTSLMPNRKDMANVVDLFPRSRLSTSTSPMPKCWRSTTESDNYAVSLFGTSCHQSQISFCRPLACAEKSANGLSFAGIMASILATALAPSHASSAPLKR